MKLGQKVQVDAFPFLMIIVDLDPSRRIITVAARVGGDVIERDYYVCEDGRSLVAFR